MLEGKTVDVRVMEREELPLFQEWLNNPKFMGEFLAPIQRTRAELEKLESSFFCTKDIHY